MFRQSAGNGPYGDEYILTRICQVWLMRENYRQRVCRAAGTIKHAGLQYLATEIEWDKVLTRWGGHVEAAELIEQLVHTADENEVHEVVDRWMNEKEG
jgi:hypothetical protein